MAEEKKITKEAEEQEKTVATAEVEALNEDDILHLTRPMNGRDKLALDFSKITGATLLKCEKKAKEVDNTIVVPQLSMVYQAHVAAAAASMRYDDIINLSGPDFMAVTTRVSRFLNNAG